MRKIDNLVKHCSTLEATLLVASESGNVLVSSKSLMTGTTLAFK